MTSLPLYQVLEVVTSNANKNETLLTIWIGMHRCIDIEQIFRFTKFQPNRIQEIRDNRHRKWSKTRKNAKTPILTPNISKTRGVINML